jgi:aminopeptidase
MPDPRYRKLADLLVHYSTEVKPGDLVLIRGTTSTEKLAIAVCEAVVRAGGRPLIRLWPEQCEEMLVRHGNKKVLAQTDPIQLYEVQTVNCMIAFLGARNNRFMAGVDPQRQAIHSKARKPILETFMKRSCAKKNRFRWCGTQMPTDSAAQDADMSTADFEDFVFQAGWIDKPNPTALWKKFHVAQQRVVDYLNNCSELRFRNKDGTDLRVGIKGRTWINCSGKSNFPDGEVFTGPIENATEGVVQYRFPAVHLGREVNDIRLEFKAGKVVDCSASKGEDFLIQMIDQDPGARTLGEIAIGTNYRIQRYMKNTLFDEKIGGTFHAALGAAYPESGGKNVSALHWDMVCDLRKGGTIEADGKVISRNGRFTNKSWPKP